MAAAILLVLGMLSCLGGLFIGYFIGGLVAYVTLGVLIIAVVFWSAYGLGFRVVKL